MSQPSPPQPQSYGKSYQQGIDVLLSNLPSLLAAEQSSRSQYDPQRIALQQAEQSFFGPTQYQQQLDALHQIDPTGTAVREQTGQQILGDLKSGYTMPLDLQRELEQSIRQAQTARGNALGNAPISAEAVFKGQNAINLYQQHLDNAGQFLGLPTPEQQLLAVQPVTPDRSSAYVDPNAGFQGAQYSLGAYPNMLAQYQLAGAGSPWTRALGGAASGAAAGSAAGGWGALLGGVAGGAAGYFSDSRLKHNIKRIGTSALGIPLVVFSYVNEVTRRVGALAQDVIRIVPDAISFGLLNGKLFATVDYQMIDIPYCEL